MAVVVTCIEVYVNGSLMFGPYGSVIEPDQKKPNFNIFVDHDYFHHVFETPVYMYSDKLIQCVSWEIQKSALKHKSCIFVLDIMFTDGTHLCNTNIVKQGCTISSRIVFDELSISQPPFGTQECSCLIDPSKLHWFKVLKNETLDLLINGCKIESRFKTVFPDNVVCFDLTKGKIPFTIRNKDRTYHIITSFSVSLKDDLSVSATTDKGYDLVGTFNDEKFDIHRFDELRLVDGRVDEFEFLGDGSLRLGPFVLQPNERAKTPRGTSVGHHNLMKSKIMFGENRIRCVTWTTVYDVHTKTMLFVTFTDGTILRGSILHSVGKTERFCLSSSQNESCWLSYTTKKEADMTDHVKEHLSNCDCSPDSIDSELVTWFNVTEDNKLFINNVPFKGGLYGHIMVGSSKKAIRNIDWYISGNLVKGNLSFSVSCSDGTRLFGQFEDRFCIHRFSDLTVTKESTIIKKVDGEKPKTSPTGPIVVGPSITPKEDNLGKEKEEATNTNKIDENDIKKCLLSNIKQIIESSNSRLSDEAMCKCKQLIELILHTESASK